jgi:hybrid cluster-associated redox disulfide protein
LSHHEKKGQITKEMTIAEALRQNPKTAQVFMRHGMHCLGCASATGETIAQAAVVHRLELDTLLQQLNEA